MEYSNRCHAKYRNKRENVGESFNRKHSAYAAIVMTQLLRQDTRSNWRIQAAEDLYIFALNQTA